MRYLGVYFDRFYLLLFLNLLQRAGRLVGTALITLVLSDRVRELGALVFGHFERQVLIVDLGVLVVYCHLRCQLIESYALLTRDAMMAACQRHALPTAVTVSVTRLQASRRHLFVDVA